jgi:hypothetical protein
MPGYPNDLQTLDERFCTRQTVPIVPAAPCCEVTRTLTVLSEQSGGWELAEAVEVLSEPPELDPDEVEVAVPGDPVLGVVAWGEPAVGTGPACFALEPQAQRRATGRRAKSANVLVMGRIVRRARNPARVRR